MSSPAKTSVTVNPNISPVSLANSFCLIINVCAACGEFEDSSLQSDARSFYPDSNSSSPKSFRKSYLIKLNTNGISKLANYFL